MTLTDTIANTPPTAAYALEQVLENLPLAMLAANDLRRLESNPLPEKQAKRLSAHSIAMIVLTQRSIGEYLDSIAVD